MRRLMEIGGLVAAVILIAFGITAIVLGTNGIKEVSSSLKQQKLVGMPEMTPAAQRAAARRAGLNPANVDMPACAVAGKAITNGSDARCFAEYMRVEALEATGGLYFSQLPRFATANGKGTDVEGQALKSEGRPVEDQARRVWVEETALSTALDASDIAEQTAAFGIVVGAALLLAGVGFAVLTVAGALRNPESALRTASAQVDAGATVGT